MTKREKLDKLNILRGELDKKVGGGKLKFGSDPSFRINKISSGSLTLDRILGGGFPLGRSVLLWGPLASAKTAIALKTIADAQAQGMVCGMVDAEKSLDQDWAVSLGVDLDSLLINQPEHGEQSVDLVEAMLRSGELKVIVVDSIAALLPKQERDVSAEEIRVGRQAALMSLALRKLTAANQGTLILFLNQEREKIGVMFGSPRTAPGGRAMGFYASQTVHLAKGGAIKEKRMAFDAAKMAKVERDTVIGHIINAKVEKDKTQAPLKKAEFVWSNELADIDRTEEIIALGMQDGHITRTGNFFVYEDVKYNGRRKFKDFLESQPDVMALLEESIVSVSRAQRDELAEVGGG